VILSYITHKLHETHKHVLSTQTAYFMFQVTRQNFTKTVHYNNCNIYCTFVWITCCCV